MEGVFTAEHKDMYGTWHGVTLLIDVGKFKAGRDDLYAMYDHSTGNLEFSWADADFDGYEEVWYGETEYYSVPEEMRTMFE